MIATVVILDIRVPPPGTLAPSTLATGVTALAFSLAGAYLLVRAAPTDGMAPQSERTTSFAF